MRGNRYLAVWVLVALFIGLRLAQMNADPPRRYPSGRSAQELLVEGPAKANEARRYGIFGTFDTKPANEYRIWSIQSPVYELPLSGFFRVFGVSRATLRVFCALAGALGLLALYAVGRRHSQPWVAPLACATYAFSFFDIQLSREALRRAVLEHALDRLVLVRAARVATLTVAMPGAARLCSGAAHQADRAVRGAGAARAGGMRPYRRQAPGRPISQHALSIGLGLALAAGLLADVRSHADWQTVEWNVGHMLVGVEARRSVSAGAISVGAVLGRLADLQRWHELRSTPCRLRRSHCCRSPAPRSRTCAGARSNPWTGWRAPGHLGVARAPVDDACQAALLDHRASAGGAAVRGLDRVRDGADEARLAMPAPGRARRVLTPSTDARWEGEARADASTIGKARRERWRASWVNATW